MRVMPIACALILSSLAGAAGVAADTERPVLATDDQLAAERSILRAVHDPRVVAAVAAARDSLLSDPAAQTPPGRVLLDHALSLWLYSLAYSEAQSNTSEPRILWTIDDTPHNWFGHSIPGSGGSGDNPDNIYVGTFLDGRSRYEIRGRIPRNGPDEFSIEVIRAEPARFLQPGATVGKGHADIGNQIRILRVHDMDIDPDGSFVLTLGPDPANGRRNHVQIPAAPVGISFRNTLSDWRRAPVPLSIRRIGPATAVEPPLTDDELARRIARDLPGWVRSWTTVKEHWMGPPPPNTLAPVLPRDGGWGFVTGGRFDLAEDEALVIDTSPAGAGYTGFIILDRWWLGGDARRVFTSLNNRQVVPNPDGTVTYVIARRDPGVANWLDTGASPQGFMTLRWQKMPQHVDGATLVRSVRVVKLAQLASALPAGFPQVTPEGRAAALRKRAADYESRLATVAE